MATLAAMMESDQLDVFLVVDDFAEAVDYTPVGAAEQEDVVVAIIEEHTWETDNNTTHDVVALDVMVPTSGTNSITSPGIGDKFTRDSQVFEVMPEALVSIDPGGAMMRFTRRTDVRRSARGLRRPRER